MRNHKYFRNAAPGKRWSNDGYSFASKLESDVYSHLKLEEKGGRIELKQTQVSVYLTDARILYKPDFLIYDFDMDSEIWIEAKGFETPVWRIKYRLWKHYGPGPLRIYKRQGSRGLTLAETVRPL